MGWVSPSDLGMGWDSGLIATIISSGRASEPNWTNQLVYPFSVAGVTNYRSLLTLK